MSAIILSDKSLKTVTPGSSPSLSSVSVVSSAPSTPPFTPSFAPNARFEVPVPALVAQLLQPVAEGSTAKEMLHELELELDLDQNISELLREGTKRAHVDAENSQGAVAMVRGELELQEYVRWLAILWRVYDTLELGLNEHASDPVLAPIYDPTVLSRADAISQDIRFLLDRLPTSSQSPSPSSTSRIQGPMPPFPLPAFLEPVFADPPGALSVYMAHLRDLASSSSTAPRLLAHAYVRYLGDLSGGQFIAARVKRSYKLDGPDGLRFYHFDLPNRDAAESKADGRTKAGEVKDWFRRGMDEGAGEDHELKASLVREANLAFALNTYLFSVIQLSNSNSSKKLLEPVKAPAAAAAASTKIAQMTHPDARPLRYYEIRELKRQEAERQRLLNPELARASKNTWRERIERFCLFGGTVVLGWAVSQYIAPYIIERVGTKMGGLSGEL